MDFQLHRVQVWSAEIPDRPGGAAGVLAPLAEAGVNLEFIWTRRLTEAPGKGVIFVAPITGATQTKAAHAAGFEKTADMVLLRIDGSDRPGLGHYLASCLATAGLNLRGLSMSAISGKFVAYVACDNAEDTTKAVQALAALQV